MLQVATRPGTGEGLKLWPCSIALADSVRGLKLDGMTVCEIGCGLGLPGMVASDCGADVTFLDKDPDVRQAVTGNLIENRLKGTVCGDFRTLDFHERFDVVLGSELLYPRASPFEIAGFLWTHWTRLGPAIFVNQTFGIASLFGDVLRDNGFNARRIQKSYCLPDGQNISYEEWEMVCP